MIFSSSSWIESMRTLVFGARLEISLAALIPSIFGIRTSRSAMSGSFSWARTTASWPSAASATTRMSLTPSSNFLRLWRNSRSSSAMRILIGMGLLLLLGFPRSAFLSSVVAHVQRQGDGDREAAAGRAFGPDAAPVRLRHELAIRKPEAGPRLEPLIARIEDVEDFL